MAPVLLAGAAAADITPRDSQFLFGYPHVSRHSTGVHEMNSLFASPESGITLVKKTLELLAQ